jgi:hypothetical protein
MRWRKRKITAALFVGQMTQEIPDAVSIKEAFGT